MVELVLCSKLLPDCQIRRQVYVGMNWKMCLPVTLHYHKIVIKTRQSVQIIIIKEDKTYQGKLCTNKQSHLYPQTIKAKYFFNGN